MQSVKWACSSCVMSLHDKDLTECSLHCTGRCENLHVVKGSPEKKVLKKVAVRWPKGTRWVSHVAFYTGEG